MKEYLYEHVISAYWLAWKFVIVKAHRKYISDVPVCKPGPPKIYGVARHEEAKILCEVQANPTDLEFTWKFNNTADVFDIPPEKVC